MEAEVNSEMAYYSALLLSLQANLFCPNRTIGITSFSTSINRTIGTNGPSELTNPIRLCILDMSDRRLTTISSELHSLHYLIWEFISIRALEFE